MTLTKNDLQQIGQILDERLELKLEEKLESKLEEKLESKFEEKLEPLRKDLKFLRRKVNRIDKTLSIVVKKYDEGDVKLSRRVSKIEKHLNLPQN